LLDVTAESQWCGANVNSVKRGDDGRERPNPNVASGFSRKASVGSWELELGVLGSWKLGVEESRLPAPYQRVSSGFAGSAVMFRTAQ
jgi:hypothetical protein